MLFIGNFFLRIWSFLVVRPLMKKAIKKEDDFDEYVKLNKDLNESYDRIKDLVAKVEKGQKDLDEHNRKKKMK